MSYTPTIKIHTNVSLNEDISATTGVDGGTGWLRVDNGFNITRPTRVNLGRAVFDAKFDIQTTVNPDNSIDYVVRNLRFSNYDFTRTGNGTWSYTVGIDAIENRTGRRRIWDQVFNFPEVQSFSRPTDYRSDIIYSGRIQPREDGQAFSEPIWLVGYFNDAHGSTLDDRIDFAIQVVNTLPPSVSPWAVYDCEKKKWLTTNRTGGGAWRYDCVSATWKPIKTIDQGKAPVKMGTGRYDCSQDKFINQSQIGAKE